MLVATMINRPGDRPPAPRIGVLHSPRNRLMETDHPRIGGRRLLRRRPRMWRISGSLCVLILGLAVVYLMTQGVVDPFDRGAVSPAPDGPLSAVRRTAVLATQTAGPPLPISVWRPVGEAIRPLILYAPGWGGRADADEVALRNLASHGYVVVAFDDIIHDAPDGSTSPDDEVARRSGFDLSSAESLAALPALASRRQEVAARKVSRVIDALQAGEAPGRPGPPTGRLDFTRIGMLGFSFGGSTAAIASRRDARLRAVANMDGDLYGEAAAAGVDLPYLILNSEYPPRHPWVARLSTWVSTSRANAERRYRAAYDTQIRQASRPGTLTLFIAGSSHDDFTDALYSPSRWRTWRPWRGPMIPRARQRAIVDAYLLAFFDTYLRDTPSPLITGAASPYPEVRVLRPTDRGSAPR